MVVHYIEEVSNLKHRKVMGCNHCGSIFQAISVYGFDAKRCISCGTALIEELTREQLQTMLYSDQVQVDVKENIIDMLAFMPPSENKQIKNCISCRHCKSGKDDSSYPHSFYSCEKSHFAKASDANVETETDCSDYERPSELQKLGEIMSPFFKGK